MQINLLKRVVENIAGSQAVKIVDLLYNKKDINEFLIAKKMGLTINQIRNLLYRLAHLGIISSIRKKDKRKGWYIYFWTFNVLKSLEVLESAISKEIQQKKNQLANKQSMRFYRCKICGREVNEESALLTDFTCSECGEVYDLADNKAIIEEISKEITKLERELATVEAEIKKVKENISQKLASSLKREESKKRRIRRFRMLQRTQKKKTIKSLKKKLREKR